MRTFYGAWRLRFGLLLPMLSGFGVFYFFVILAIQRAIQFGGGYRSLLFASVPFGIFSLLMGFYILAAIVESFAAYIIDDDKIEKRAVYGACTMLWNSITDLKTRGLQNSDIELTDHRGRRMRITLQLLNDKRGELRAAVNDHLSALRDRQKQNFEWQEKTYRPTRTASYLILPMLLTFVGFALWSASAQNTSGPDSARLGLLVLLGALGLLSALMWLYLFTRTVTIRADSISDSSAFGSRTIPLNQIRSFMTRNVSTKNGSINTTTIEGARGKISLSETMPDYTLVQDYLRSKAGEQAVKRGQAAVPLVQKREDRQTLIIASLVSVLGLGGMSLYFISTARDRLERHHQLDVRGVRTFGFIDGTHTEGSKSTTYLIDYEFTLNSRTYHHSSPVARSDFDQAMRGQRIGVIYLPDNPDNCRVLQSVGEQQAEGMVRSGYLLLAMAFVFPLLIGASIAFKNRKGATGGA